MRPFLLFAVGAIVVVLIAHQFFFGPNECLDNGFGCADMPTAQLSIADRINDPAQCSFLNRKGETSVFEFDPLRKRSLKATKIEDLKDIVHVALHLSLSLPIDTTNRATLPDQIIARFDSMSDCQLCDWAVFASRPSAFDTIQSRKVLADNVAKVATTRLRGRGIELNACSRILSGD